ncbi:hypothetical protein M422DRAFT_261667 [Sphaerobolus stellatus SS14]|uniref:Uncharacterized protein n=1 Tax=Sphaerobolus stellatus (strain SS14) TaxID=990650 RepID=A0A0C9VEU2_SPHS4|nr:hypothetical protein M422DRAFT_261667 [Sphaerobolus stellatus SS14]
MAIYKQGQPTNNHGQTRTNLYKHGQTRTDMYKLGRIIRLASASPRHCICSLSALFRLMLAYLLGGLTFLPICCPHGNIFALTSHHKTHCIDDLSDAQGMTYGAQNIRCNTPNLHVYRPKAFGCTLDEHLVKTRISRSSKAARSASTKTTQCRSAQQPLTSPATVYACTASFSQSVMRSSCTNAKMTLRNGDEGLVSCTSRYATYDTAVMPTRRARTLNAPLNATPDLVSTRWLNPILGLFLSAKETTTVKVWAIGRLMRSYRRFKTPSFLKSVVRSFSAGSVAPFYSKPMFKELTPDGEPPSASTFPTPHSIGDHLFIQCIDLLPLCEKDRDGNADKKENKSYEVGLVLAVVMKKLVGNMIVKIKKPPSNCIWYAFATMP